jgi:beta-lactamase regulating signal transducer with metallopeptidase domain
VSTLGEAAAAAKDALALLAVLAAHGTVLVLIALPLARRRVRPAWQAAVWTIVLVKFVLPWGPAMPWSLADLIATLRGGDTGGAVPAVAPGYAAAAAPDAAPLVGWILLWTAWLAGAAVVLSRALGAHVHARRAARSAPQAPEAARAVLAALARRIRVRTPRLVVAEGTGPHVVGALRPIIVVPSALVDDPQLLRGALLHELAHVRRRDALVGVVQLAARAAFWWWPVVHYASRRLELAREQACDAWALETGDISRPAYARLLLRMAQLRTVAGHALAAPHALDRRVSAVLGPAARPRLGLAHRGLLAAFAVVALGGARTAAARGHGEVCVYTPELAVSLLVAHPSADADGDGYLSREEACDFQAELRKRMDAEPQVSTLDEASTELLAEPLCCNCEATVGPYGPLTSSTEASCQKEEGVSR